MKRVIVTGAASGAVQRLGGLDVLINNAGVGHARARAWRPTRRPSLDVNLIGPWRVTAAAMPALLESHGRLVNVASGLAFPRPPSPRPTA